MDHESTRLTDRERRILAEIEADSVRTRRRHRALLHRNRTRQTDRRARPVSWTAVIIGSTLLAVGLWVGVMWAAAAGFVAVVIGLSGVTADLTPARGLSWLNRLIGLGDDETRRGGG
jgi:DUF3040 family protein